MMIPGIILRVCTASEGRRCFEKPSLTCSLVWLIILILAIGMGVGIAILIIQGADKPPVAPTTCGMVEGAYDVEPNVYSYKVGRWYLIPSISTHM